MIDPSDTIQDVRSRIVSDGRFRNELGRCPVCNSNIKDRTVALYSELLRDLYRVYDWCLQKGVHEFKMSQVRHLIDKMSYARFGDLVRFGGVVYRPEVAIGIASKGKYGINMERAATFFRGDYQIPLYIVINPVTREVVDSHFVTVRDIPELARFLDAEGVFVPLQVSMFS